MTDLIKREDALAAINAFERDFEQSWKVQFSADIKALPAIDPAAIREAALDKLTKAVEALQWYADFKNHIVPDDSGPQPIDLDRGDVARAVLAELEEEKK